MQGGREPGDPHAKQRAALVDQELGGEVDALALALAHFSVTMPRHIS